MKKQISKLWIMMMCLVLISFMEITFVNAEYLSQKQDNLLGVIIQSNNAADCNITSSDYTTQSDILTNWAMMSNKNELKILFK